MHTIDKNEQMTLVIVGHVDHGKSTVIGRLLADTGSLPEGKLEQIKRTCAQNAKPFEYAFLLDALKDEQAQGITIDSARVFFKSFQRRYIIFDAPGHIEFLKNMVTGAAHAQAALLVIDAHEGIKENSRRHGYLLSMLGVRQISVLINKMDIVGWDKNVFDSVVKQYSEFLSSIGVSPITYIPISALNGDNIASQSSSAKWYKGPTVLQQLDSFHVIGRPSDLPLRFPVQDIYKFTEKNDERRILAGTIETGSVRIGDEVVFSPSKKIARISSIEEFNKTEANIAQAGQAIGFTINTQLYLKPGELMTKKEDPLPEISTRFSANIFWLGKTSLLKNKRYRLKLATSRVAAQIVEIRTVIDASELSASKEREEVNTHEVAEIVIETEKPIAFDVTGEIEATSRFVLVDNYEISGGGIITGASNMSSEKLIEHVRQREFAWIKSEVSNEQRKAIIGHESVFVLIVGKENTGKIAAAHALEASLIKQSNKAYYLGISNLLCGMDSDMAQRYEDKDEHLRRLGEMARIMTDAGMIFIATASDVDEYDIAKLRILATPASTIVISFGEQKIGELIPDAHFPINPNAQTVATSVTCLLNQKNII